MQEKSVWWIHLFYQSRKSQPVYLLAIHSSSTVKHLSFHRFGLSGGINPVCSFLLRHISSSLKISEAKHVHKLTLCKVWNLQYKTDKRTATSNWARSCKNVSYAICEQQRRRSACTSAQSDQHLCCSLLR